jgi:hypothetical protein
VAEKPTDRSKQEFGTGKASEPGGPAAPVGPGRPGGPGGPAGHEPPAEPAGENDAARRALDRAQHHPDVGE